MCSKTSARRSNRLVWRALIALCCLTTGSAARAQSPIESDRSFWFYFENDAFGGTSDSSYTNGVRVGWEFAYGTERLGRLARLVSLEALVAAVRGPIRPATAKCVPQGSREENRPCLTIGFGLSQTMYTPSNIIDTTLQRGDRPYAGLTYGSAIVNTLRRGWQYSTEFQLGVMGPWSSAESAQSLAHWVWASSSEKPRGWRHQLGNTMQVGVVNTWQHRWLEWCSAKPILDGDPRCDGTASEERKFDVTARYEGTLGTHMTRASAGLVVRAGNRFPDAMALTRISTTAPARRGLDARPYLWGNALLTADIRYVGRNALITGNAVDNVPGRFGYERTITFRRNVGEMAAGGTIGYGPAMAAFQVVWRQKEYEPGGGWHRFGAITFSLFTPQGR